MAKAEAKTPPANEAHSHNFQAEVAKLLHLMVHSVYSDRDVFLRELISNAADALDKLRYEAIARPDLTSGDADLAITITPDKAAKALTIADNGIGMSEAELIDNLGTIAKSGTQAFMEQAKTAKTDVHLIGQFGIGFYSSFMVAGKVEVISRKAGDAQAFLWSSDGSGTFAVEPAPEDQAPARGTRIVLHLKEDAQEFLE
ncbi:MAG: ATP-binding protein, partial [Parvibaculaceae bacterium]